MISSCSKLRDLAVVLDRPQRCNIQSDRSFIQVELPSAKLVITGYLIQDVASHANQVLTVGPPKLANATPAGHDCKSLLGTHEAHTEVRVFFTDATPCKVAPLLVAAAGPKKRHSCSPVLSFNGCNLGGFSGALGSPVNEHGGFCQKFDLLSHQQGEPRTLCRPSICDASWRRISNHALCRTFSRWPSITPNRI